MSEMKEIEWNHPRLGRIREIACHVHAGEVLAALGTLGIGSGGTPVKAGATCLRCAHAGQRARVFLPTAVAVDEPDLPE